MSSAYRGLAMLMLAAAVTATCAAGEAPKQVLNRARTAYEQQDFAQAQRLAEGLVEEHGTSAVGVDAHLLLIDALASQKKYMKAYEQCEALLAAHPTTRRRSDVLRREFELGKALTASRSSVLIFSFPRLQDGVKVLEQVIEHAPFGPLADDSVFAIAEGHRIHGEFEAARDHYERLIKSYPRSDLVRRALIGRAACNYHLTEGAPYDNRPAHEAEKDFDILARAAGGAKEVTERRDVLRDVIAKGNYDAGLFYFRNGNVEAGLRYLESVIAEYPDSTYARRARRLLQEAIIAKFPDTEHAERARRALAQSSPRAGTSKETP
jgi:outer membrane assembly lipoprotein YfiO